MKFKLLFAYFFLILLVACNKPKPPQFVDIHNIEVLKLSTKKAILSAEATIHNPNAIGATITNSDLHIELMDKYHANVKQLAKTHIPANESFNVPFEFEFNPREVLNKDIFNSALNLLVNKKMLTHFKGTITVDLAGFDVNIPLDIKKEIPLKKLKRKKK